MAPLEFLAIAILASCSAFLSGSEIALFSLSRFQIRSLKERSHSAYNTIRKLLADPSGILISILVLNEVINILMSSMIATLTIRSGLGHSLAEIFGHLKLEPWLADMVISTLLTAPIILLVCEITPKVVSTRANQLVAPLTARPMHWIYSACFPFRFLLGRLVRSISKTRQKKLMPLKEEEFMVMIEEGHEEGEIHESELELVRNVFELDDTAVSDVLTPMTRVATLPATTTIKQALAHLKKSHYSRIPVTRGNKKHVVGILYRKDLLLSRFDAALRESDSIENLTRKPLMIHPQLKLNTVFRRLKQNRTHIACVENEKGDALGIVTMTDVLSAIFEDALEPETISKPTTGVPK